jgi:hypothetical protein
MPRLVADGWRYRELYDCKSTFITLVLDDGADESIIRDRVTHAKRQRGAFDAEVVKLKLPTARCSM